MFVCLFVLGKRPRISSFPYINHEVIFCFQNLNAISPKYLLCLLVWNRSPSRIFSPSGKTDQM